MFNSHWVGPTTRAFTVILIVVAAYFLIDFTLPLLYPFILGWAIAMLIEPLVQWLEKRFRLPRWAGVTIILFLLLTLIFSLVIFLVAEIVVELTRLAEFLPSFLGQAGQIFIDFTKENTDIKRIIDTVQAYLEKNPEHQQRISASIQENIGIIANKGTEQITGILSGIGAFLGDLPYFLTVLIFITLAAFFIGLDWPRFRQNLLQVIPERVRVTGGLVIRDMKKALFGFIRAQLTLISITAVIMFLGLLVLNVRYAFTLAFVIGLVDLLPYLGVGAVLVPWIIYLFLTGNVQLGIGLSIVYGVIIVVRQFLEPKLVASNVGLDPLLTLISLFVGLKLFGFLGLIIGPVTVVILLALHRANVLRDIWKFIVGKKDYPKQKHPSV
ncbi:sporulation integral membrane protein YtvI [Paenactinomyces guangxiensis]|uniref:Sporulation integral membrane protein YtvI n=1 Tax=Paenactinomyces guangxiensis TaxID=1490290 RepID=A0A7W2A9K2_9BACL|nr:sporulation integral membrane protein YtvI [Paenactinomyces guangxiensis]MBA4495287.1 sporulation integral membrane protein YtvI [Paenactinomyces guangxiensis]MBH8592371.1 sporulation integral membrane protein YtvI [Paenactinomyces guangxiensis]